MTVTLSQRLQRNHYLKQYLVELEALVGHPVRADELSSLEQVISMQEDAQKCRPLALQSCEIQFADRLSGRFKKFVRRLHDANSSSIHIWTPHTINCGVLLVASLAAIKFDFDFTINSAGILSFSTSDLKDSLLLDFSVSPAGEQVMKVETQGSNWASVAY